MNDTEKLINLKKASGTHSPSTKEIESVLGYNPVKHDFCFLSNPYATIMLMEELVKSIDSKGFFKVLEEYPASNSYIAKNLSKIEGLNPEEMVVGNGAIECIYWATNYCKITKLLIPVPTFSSYYEFSSDYELYSGKKDTAISLLNGAKESGCDAILIIYPNNPDGAYIDLGELEKLLMQREIKIIVDESFCHFLNFYHSYKELRGRVSEKHIFLKSMSKDFGIAGTRLGYFYTKDEEALNNIKKYTTWNINNLAVMSSDILARPEFIKKYENVRIRYNKERDEFYNELLKLDFIKVAKSGANFFLLNSDKFSIDFVFKLLVENGIYVRTMEDKVGLDSKSIRVASRTSHENMILYNALKEAL